MKKKIVAIIGSLLIMFGMICPMNVKAETTKNYISAIYFSSDNDNKGDCVKDLTSKGVPSGNVIDHDFNCYAKGKFVYLGYKTTTNPDEAIRGLIFLESKVNSLSHNGITYYPITNASSGGTLDFNQGTGKGKDIYLYYTKDKKAGPPISKLGAWCSRHGSVGGNLVSVRKTSGEVEDANNGVSGSSDVFLTYGCDEESFDKSTKQTSYKVYENPDDVPIGKVIYKNWLESNDIVRNWVNVANALNTGNTNKKFGGDTYRMQVGSLTNINNPQMAASAITSNNDVKSSFSSADQPTFYLKGDNAGLIFTNFQFVDDVKFFSAAADDVKVGDSLNSLEEKGIQVHQGTVTSQEVDTMENRAAQSANLDSSYRNAKSISNTLSVSNTNASEFRTDTTIGISQSFKYNIPFGGSGSTTVNVEETIGYTTSSSKTRSNENTDTEERESSSTVSITIPAHTKCSILKQISTGEVVQSYNSACILTYDVYYIKDAKYYHFTGTSDKYSKYSNAAENVYHRAVTFPSLGIKDTKQDSTKNCEGTVNWSDVMNNHPLAKNAIYDLYRKVPITPYGGTLTSVVKQTTYKSGAYEPLYKLASLKPSVTTITMSEEDTYDLENVNIKAKDDYDIDWYGFYKDRSGEWEVVSGPVKVTKNKAGNWELTATGTGKAVIRYNPSNVAESKISKDLDNRGITVNITKKDGEIQSVKPSKTSLSISLTDSDTKIKENLSKLKITGTCINKKTITLTNSKNAWKISGDKATGTFNAPKGYIFKNGKESITISVNLKTTLSKSHQKLAAYQPLLAKAAKSSSSSITLNWSKIKGATGYIIYDSKFEKVKDTKSNSYTVSKLKKGTFYNYTVVAYKTVKGNKTILAVSKQIYETTTGGSYGNTKSVKVNKTSVSLKAKKTYTLKASEVKKDKKLKKYRALSYETSNAKIATVNSKGKITAKKKGSCYIYVYAQNGISVKVKVTVK